MEEIILDCTENILGRLCSYAARQLKLGKKVILVNCEKVIIIGDEKIVFDRYVKRTRLGKGAQKGPFFPRGSEQIVRRTVRGMIHFKRASGRDKLKNVICFNGIPAQYQNKGIKNIGKVDVSSYKSFITMERLSKLLKGKA
ncbi:50S ribosomal protein L13 [Candidatus Pacearchaeota archaeon CG_4_9_14_3_um_filter_31_7]|nr:MAG: 50S ribosomal protein L13 [Candidatus Pacearchaeota archaeon CG1_02_31_27]PIN92424.1 MAG: 50S ribosomal protein L13 [Candidatus Pacearchaeota archaeon CG10_big_fil_rev_8_21_14_0_10_31_59]PIZ81009.1 MAG: 50S ribosomal protein L13 [Candidatus Pacearchaeota archaeon CG_4_10_14_0_2_um_filter_31_10]PJA70506.1 MAG: 50S ribosomal protein L13 [Candidatus Pacearchaeota archaeon CG_4_9_14_3_um_filter_31_7]